MLVAVPIGLWIVSLVCDLVRVAGSSDPAWQAVSFYAMAGGVAAALLAVFPGLMDLLSLPAGARKTALAHLAVHLTITSLYGVNLWLRWRNPAELELPLWLSLAAIALLMISSWLGGRRVYRYRLGVDPRTFDAGDIR